MTETETIDVRGRLGEAYHVAGHVVVACALGVPVYRAEVGGRSGGFTTTDDLKTLRPSSVLAVLLAGRLAEAKATNTDPLYATYKDDEAAAARLARFVKPPVCWVAERTRAILSERWTEVTAVALELHECGALTGSEIRRVLVSVMNGNWPLAD